MTAHNQDDIFRYLSGDLPDSENDRVVAHLNECRECSDLLAFVRDFNSNLKAMPPEDLKPDTPCPDSNTIAAFAADELDKSSAQLVRQHTIFCRGCFEEVFLLRRAAKAAGIRTIPGSSEAAAVWGEIFVKAREFVIDMGKTYGLGMVIGSARIMAEQPVPAMRGSQAPRAVSKVLEVAIGENTYSVEVKVDEGGSLSCDIAGIHTPAKEPLRVSVHSERGEELPSTESDKSGNCRFAVPSASGLNDFLIFSFALKEAEQSFLVCFPETDSSI